MRVKLLFFCLLVLFSFEKLISQRCEIKNLKSFEFAKHDDFSESKIFFSLKFKINGIDFSTIDTNRIRVPINNKTFDSISYSFVNDKNELVRGDFLCKFKADEKYTISPCTCCGIFLVLPSKNANRGYVKFKNNSSSEFIGMVSEIDYEEVLPKKTTDYIFSSISMNCGFRPSYISLALPSYLNKKYQFENWSTKTTKEIRVLHEEQNQDIVYRINYLFLHKEKLTISIDEDGSDFELILDK